MDFEFFTPTHIKFGPGKLDEIFSEAKKFGEKAFIVNGKKSDRTNYLIDGFKKAGISHTSYSVASEPTIEIVKDGTALSLKENCDFVIAMGGGSVIDTGKAISALMTNPGDIFNYLEVIGDGKPLENIPAPFISIPTTAGTGAEITCNAVIASTQHKVKVSLRNVSMYPKLTIVDPQLTYSLPPALTAATGLDALTQLLEAFVSIKANPFADALCRDGIKMAISSIRKSYENPEDKAAREDMSLAALFSGIALANSKLGAVHGIASPVGALLNAPHGFVCARLLPFVIEANVRAVQARGSHMKEMLNKYVEIGSIVSRKAYASASDAVRFLHDLCRNLKIPTLSQFGLTHDLIPDLVKKAQNASSMKGNSITLTNEEIENILKQAV